MQRFKMVGSVSGLAIAIAAAVPASAQVQQSGAPVAAPATDPSAPAQTTPAVSPDQQSEMTPGTVADIVVTARKREERLRDVPVAVTALGGDYLQQKNITQVVDLTVTVPNLNYSTASTQPQLFIRGVGSGTNEGFDQSVAKFVDNVYFGGPHDAKIPIFDVERVEVLKGPQVIAFGNSATAGALSVTTIKPGNVLAADASINYDFVDREVKAQGGITLPIADGASFRLAGLVQNLARGDRYNALLNTHEMSSTSFAVRPTLKLDPTPDLDIVVLGEYDSFYSFGSPYLPIRQSLNPAAPQYLDVANPNVDNQNYERAPVSSDQFFQQRSGLLMANISYNVFGGSLVSTTAYRAQRNLVQLGLPGPNYNETFFQHDLQKFNQLSQEVRFFGTYGRLDLSVGAYYEHQNRHIDGANTFLFNGFGVSGTAGTPTDRIYLFDQSYDKYSAVVDATYRIVGGLSVSAGMRYSRYNKDASEQTFGAEVAPNLGFYTTRAYLASFETAAADARLPSFGATPHVFPLGSLKLRENDWQPQGIVQYKFGQNMIYAKYVKGAKAGGFDSAFGPANPSGIQFSAEKGEMFEGGIKGTTANRLLDYSLIGFRETFTGLQQSYLVNTSFLVTNAGVARSQGVELELNARPAPGLRFSFSGSYLDAHFVSYPNAPCNTYQTFATPSGCRQDRSGTPLQFASKWSGTVGVDYDARLGDYLLTGGPSVFGRSSFNAGAVNDPGAVQHGFAMLDFHLDLKPQNGSWTVGVFGRNMTDVRYLNYVVSPPGNSLALLSGYERGRQVGLRFAYKYR